METVRATARDLNLNELPCDIFVGIKIDNLISLISARVTAAVFFTLSEAQGFYSSSNEGAINLKLNVFLEGLEIDQAFFLNMGGCGVFFQV